MAHVNLCSLPTPATRSCRIHTSLSFRDSQPSLLRAQTLELDFPGQDHLQAMWLPCASYIISWSLSFIIYKMRLLEHLLIGLLRDFTGLIHVNFLN